MKDEHILSALLLVVLLAGAAAFYRFYILRDYVVFATVPCDPAAESCFIGSDEEALPRFYKYIQMPANTLPRCNAANGECDFLSCTEGDESCSETLCDPETEEVCSTPAS